MKKIAVALVPLVLLVGCTQTTKDTLKEMAAAGIDIACGNLSVLDAEWHKRVPTPNAAAQLGYNAAMGTIQLACNNRPLNDPVNQRKAVEAAVTTILNLIARYAIDQAG